MERPLLGYVGQTTFGESAVIDVPFAVNEVRITQMVHDEYPPIAGIIQYLASGVMQGVLPDPDSARLIRVTRDIVDSYVAFGYVAMYVNPLTNELGVVPPRSYLAVTLHEYVQITGKPLPREHIQRRKDARLIRSHRVYFPSTDDEELYFHDKFGAPMLFIGDWAPWMGVPTTPCRNAYEALTTRRTLIRAAQVTAKRSMQPATGYVMSQPPGGMGSLLNSMAGLSSGIGPNDAMRLLREQTDALHEAHAEMMQETQQRLLSYSIDGIRADQISSVIEDGGNGHMAWAPRIETRELDAGNQLDLLASEIAYRYCIPPRALNLRVVAMKSATTSIGDATMGFTATSFMLCHVQHALSLSREIALKIDPQTVVPSGDLKPNVPPEIITAMDSVLSHKGRRALFSETLRVDPSFIAEKNIDEIKGEYLVKVAAERSKHQTDDGEPPAKRVKS